MRDWTATATCTLLLAVGACSRPAAVDAPGATAGGPIVPGEWTQDLDAALALGKAERLPLLLNFMGSDWCGVCQAVERDIFSQPEWKAYAASNLVMVALDFPRNKALVPAAYRTRNEQLAREFAVEGFPTFVLVDPEENSAIARFGVYRGMRTADMIRDVRHLTRLTPGAIARAESRLPPESLAPYRDLLAQLRTANSNITAWVADHPRRTKEDLATYKEMMRAVDRLQAAADELETGAASAP